MTGVLSHNDESLESLILDSLEKPHYVHLEIDCYSIAAAKNCPGWAAAALPLFATASQLIVLYFLAIGRGNIFQDGHWIKPIATHNSVNVMVFISLIISVTKISTEFQHAQRLYSALLVGEFGTHCKRVYCWWALLLQYVMASAVLVVSVNMVLAAESCQGSILKTLSVFIVVDMDNLMARFIRVWLSLDFFVKVQRSADDTEVPATPSPNGSCATEKARPRFPGNCVFHACPLALLVAEIIIAISYDTLPLTLLLYGCVSNSKAPIIPIEPVCSDVVAGSARCSVLVLAPEDEDAPRLYWIGLKAFPEPREPTPLEVFIGRDGTYNAAYLTGSALSESVQVQAWLRSHNFSDSLYHRLVKHNFLYQSFLPYEAKFEVDGLQVYGMAFRLYIAALNSATKALSSSILSSRLFYVRSHCEENCHRCEKYNYQVCLECVPRMHLSRAGKCEACPSHCRSCRKTSWQCDQHGCGHGFLWNGTHCTKCSVEHCATCEKRGQSCNICEKTYGRTTNASGDFCLECDEVCAKCNTSNRSLCLECRIGYGLMQNTCLPCPHKCSNCTSDGNLRCNKCAPGWGLVMQNTSSLQCKRCDDEDNDCTDCFWNRVGIFNCTACKSGKGMTPNGRCDSCGARCHKCSESGFCKECLPGFALTHHGGCKSCADNCQTCKAAGPGDCDKCKRGFTRSNSAKSGPCVPDHQEDSGSS